MPTLKALLLQVLLTMVPPGNTKYSVVPVQCRADDCDDYRFSSYYDARVRQETAEDAAPRYETIADAAVDAAAIELCRDADGKKRPVEDCQLSPDMQNHWSMRAAIVTLFGAAIPESGLREDVQMGRGRAKHPDDVGGEGRGPGGEACLMQIHPAVAWRFVPDLTQAERAAAAATGPAREELVRTLVGSDHDALVRCFRTGLRMLARAATHCDWDARRQAALDKAHGLPGDRYSNLDWAMYSMYGTGQSCRADNRGKTTIRTTTAMAVASALERAKAAAAAKERASKRKSAG